MQQNLRQPTMFIDLEISLVRILAPEAVADLI